MGPYNIQSVSMLVRPFINKVRNLESLELKRKQWCPAGYFIEEHSNWDAMPEYLKSVMQQTMVKGTAKNQAAMQQDSKYLQWAKEHNLCTHLISLFDTPDKVLKKPRAWYQASDRN